MTDEDTSLRALDTLPTVVCIVGSSDAGKTGLVERLVPRLAENHRVATIKSIHHDIEPDTPGKDTHRHREAGADTVVGITPSYTFEVTPGGKGTDAEADDSTKTEQRAHELLGNVIERLGNRGYDIVLVEGYTSAPLPKIVVGEAEGTIADDILATGDPDPDDLVARLEQIGPPREFLRDVGSC